MESASWSKQSGYGLQAIAGNVETGERGEGETVRRLMWEVKEVVEVVIGGG